MNGYYLKAPGAEIDYSIDWTAGYLEDGETIAADLGWTVFPSDVGPDGLSVTSAAWAADVTTATLRGGRFGATYRVASKIRTNRDRIDERAFVVRIAPR